MESSIACAKAGVTTGEMGHDAQARVRRNIARRPELHRPRPERAGSGLDEIRAAVDALSVKLGRRIKFLVGKPGLDGHSNGAEQIACARPRRRHGSRLRGHPPDAGTDRAGSCRRERACRRTFDPVRLARAAGVRAHGPHAQGRARRHSRRAVGGIIPPEDEVKLKAFGVCGGLYAQGLPAQRHHGRHRAARRRAGEGGVALPLGSSRVREETRRKLEGSKKRQQLKRILVIGGALLAAGALYALGTIVHEQREVSGTVRRALWAKKMRRSGPLPRDRGCPRRRTSGQRRDHGWQATRDRFPDRRHRGNTGPGPQDLQLAGTGKLARKPALSHCQGLRASV